MFKPSKLLFCFGISLLVFNPFVFADESITITTYYPSPYGSYNDLYVANTLGIGTASPGGKLHIHGGGSFRHTNSVVGDGLFTWFDFSRTSMLPGSGKNYFIETQSAGSVARSLEFSLIHGGDYIFGVAGNARMVIKDGGYVGIGTAGPGSKLDVYESATTNPQNSVLKIEGYADAVNEGPFIDFHERWSGNYPNWIVARIGGVYETSSGGSNRGALVFYTADSSGAASGTAATVERMRIQGNGNVGIGTMNPTAKLHISDSTANGTGILVTQTNATNSNGITIQTQTTGAGDSPLWVASGGGSIPCLIIRSTGNVGIGTTNPGYKLQVTQSAADWTIHANGTGGYGLLGTGANYAGYFQGPTWCSSGVWAGSDLRWKKNIAALDNPLLKLSKLRGVKYDWRREEFKTNYFPEGRQIGIIA